MHKPPLPNSVTLVEVGPRDGLQSEPDTLEVDIRVEFIRRLIDAGLRRIEVASFVNPRRVPQMAGAEEVVAGIPPRDGLTRIGLALNERGFERALACGIDEVGFVIVASDTFNQRNQGAGTEESLHAWQRIAAAARAHGMRANVTISTAFGCPFEGEIPVKRVIDIARRVLEGDPVELAIADTIGVANPWQVRILISQLIDVAGDTPLRCHFHNTRNTGFANAFAAIDAGVRILDASTGGIGGCPFAPAATGNIATEDLVYMLHRAGISTGVSLPKLLDTANWLSQQTGRPVPGMLTRAGEFPGSRPSDRPTP